MIRYLRMAIIIMCAISVGTLGTASAIAQAQESRPFDMGFTTFPYEVSLAAVDYTYRTITADADLFAHHFDNGVPWPEALAKQPFPVNLRNEWIYRKSKTPSSHKIYLSVTPINFMRNGLATYRGEKEDMPLPAPWNRYDFDHPDVQAAFLHYCQEAIHAFAPDYLNIGIEVNLLLNAAPEKWASYLRLHQATYTALKREYPDLPIFVSIYGASLLDGYTEDDVALHRKALAEIMPYSDYFALSLYPYTTRFMTARLPTTMFDELRRLSDKPMAVAETGYIAQPLTVTINGAPFTIDSDENKQDAYIMLLLEAATKHRFKFIINFVLRDYDAIWEMLGKTDLAATWRDTGLYDESGTPRKALTTWRGYLERPRE
ncbi:MAG: hypothetical protein OHK0023_15110 [Anaerolineae bacterium]